jgi:uncharacterized membrane protein
LRLAIPIAVAIVLGVWMVATPAGLLGKADAIGYAVCHRIEVRSFHMGDRPLPLCARCTGLYLGAAATLAYFHLAGRRGAGGYPARGILFLLGLFGLAFAIDGLNSYASLFPWGPILYEPRNEFRLATGLLAGITLGSLVFPACQQAVWADWRRAKALRGGRDLLALLAIAVGLFASVETENPLLLYPLALASALGVVLVLTLVYGVLALSAFRRENEARAWGNLAGVGAAGFGLALLQIGALDLVRFALTGTWSGLQF